MLFVLICIFGLADQIGLNRPVKEDGAREFDLGRDLVDLGPAVE